ncbi:4-aminobutyrate--2-oxoglutarate transaminase [Desulfobacterota bacterium AH_259_B03_O07]|nr:4-aminobutyrate--2-oxoglutarate transaminase [Desulfobacterota bacterium AH_259_B03_O07]
MTKLREDVKTKIPGPKSKHLIKLREKYIPRGVFNTVPAFIQQAKDALITDIDGNTFIDFASGLATMNVGYSRMEIIEALGDQIEKYHHTCFHVFMYEPYVRLAEKLAEITPGKFPKKTILVNSGAEAVENAIKVSRSYTKRKSIITFEHAFHGRTLLGMTLTSKIRYYKLGFGPFASEVYRMPYAYCYRCPMNVSYPECNVACLDQFTSFFKTQVDPEEVAAVIVEPVTGEGGFIVPPPEFLPEIGRICRENGIVFIVDEVQTGFGRTGEMFAVNHYNLEPDIIVMGKSIAAGLPLGAVTGRAEILESPEVGSLGGTFGGNPLSCIASLNVIEIMREKGFMEHARKVGDIINDRLRDMQNKYNVIGEARGLGAMAAIELVKDRDTKEPAKEATSNVIKLCYENGLVIMKAGVYDNVVRLLVPLIITEDLLLGGLDILENAVRIVNRGNSTKKRPRSKNDKLV